jgi:glycosyltransferase involved in cell wall biosynthesis
MKIAFVVQRYGLDINGGAELHCRYVAERLLKYSEVDVLTTCATDYIRWRNHYPEGTEKINGISVKRFRVEKERNPMGFGRLQEELLRYAHTEDDELRWIDEQGPNSPELIRFIRRSRDVYDFFIFFSYRYYHSYFGLQVVPHKSLLVPTAEEDAIVKFPIFRNLFNLPRAFVYNSVEERRMIQSLSSNYHIPGEVVGVGSELPATTDADAFRRKFKIDSPYLLYVGRIDENKGCKQLFDFFTRYILESKSSLKLVLIGSPVMKIPDHPSVIQAGFLQDQDKYNALAGCEVLMMPSFFESLSMVMLEAWGMGKPTLANANCPVLMGQSIRSNAGLFYSDYQEFKRCLDYLRRHPDLRMRLGRNGSRFYQENYRWDIIEQKYLNLMNAVKN